MATVTSMAFGELLRRYRVAAGLSQEALAERAGLSARAISDMERDAQRTPRRDTIGLLAKALEIAPTERATLEAAARRPRMPPTVLVPADRPGPVRVDGHLWRRRQQQSRQ